MANQMAILRKVLRRIRRYWVGLVASLLLATLYVVMSLYIPILVGNAIDCIIDAGRVDFTAMWGYLRNVAICAAVAALAQASHFDVKILLAGVNPSPLCRLRARTSRQHCRKVSVKIGFGNMAEPDHSGLP